jgi:hypothetical protein
MGRIWTVDVEDIIVVENLIRLGIAHGIGCGNV